MDESCLPPASPNGPEPCQGAAPSKGMALIAAYRAARIAGRPQARQELQSARTKFRKGMGLDHAAPSPAAQAMAAAETGLASAGPEPGLGEQPGIRSIFTQLVDAASAAHMLHAPAPPAAEEVPPPVEVTNTEINNIAVDAAAALNAVPQDGPIQDEAPPNAAETLPPPNDAPTPEQTPPKIAVGLDIIGFGPGMQIRLNQLGIHTAADLAASNATNLRGALGDISRLINVEAWISRAREACV